MKTIRLPLLAVLGLALTALTSPAWAKVFNLPDDKPVITVNFPDSWAPEEIDRGVQGQTKDTAVYLSIEATKSEKEMNAIIEESFAMFKEHKVEVDKSTQKENKLKIAGEDATELLYTGKDEDGPTVISITIFAVGDAAFVITYWASTESEAKYQKDIGKIVTSIKKAE